MKIKAIKPNKLNKTPFSSLWAFLSKKGTNKTKIPAIQKNKIPINSPSIPRMWGGSNFKV